jgi:TolB-like protein/tetratricopeptide (TPR) repeat protein
MAEFFAELKRRQIYRVGAAYVVAAWVLTQVIEILAQVFTLPLWIAQTAIVLLAIGFPVALLAVWTIESKPHEAVASAVRSKPTIVDWTLCGALAVVLLFMGYQQLAPRQAGVDAAKDAAASPRSAISLAVLPFANLSGDPSQEFFSDGITEEITSALARVPDLRVVARTSAYQFRDQNRDIQSIGQQLRATHFIEGSVRKAGDRVRITAQMIDATDGTHVWTETYDRELTDMFAIQEEIARAIATSLRMPLGIGTGQNLVSGRTIDPESYQQYLRAKALFRLLGQGRPRAIEVLEPLVARNPDYAPAWGLLASAYGLTPNLYRNSPFAEMQRVVSDLLPKAEAAAHRAMALDPNLAEGYLALSRVHAARGNFVQADELRRKALALDPNHADALQVTSNWLATAGRVKEAVALKQLLRSLEPLVPSYNVDFAEFLWVDGQTDAAIAILKEVSPSPASNAGAKIDLAAIYASQGRYDEAADVLLQLQALPNQNQQAIAEAARLLRTAPAVAASPQSLPRLGALAFVYLHVGAPGRILEPYEEWGEAGYFVDIAFPILWHPSYAPVRKLERFKTYVRKAGFVDYWRAKGWPDLCRSVGNDDFVCE